MTGNVNLSVNNMPINLDHFVRSYIEHIANGVVASLKDTGEIESLKLAIDNEGQVQITLNNTDIPLKYFPIEIIRSTILGMVAPLKGVEGEVNNLELTISP